MVVVNAVRDLDEWDRSLRELLRQHYRAEGVRRRRARVLRLQGFVLAVLDSWWLAAVCLVVLGGLFAYASMVGAR